MKRLLWMPAVAALALLLGGVGQVKAALITSPPAGSTLEPMPPVNYFGGGPETFGTGITITWSSTNTSNQGGSVFGYTGGYGFSSNGFWDGSLGPMAGVNDSTKTFGVRDTMTFAFSTPQQTVGGFMNYAPGYGTPTIAVYDSSHTLIESYVPTFLTGGAPNSGQFLGFQESTANIAYFTLTDAYLAIVNLRIGGGAVSATPEPSSLALFGIAGSTLAGFFGWRRRKQTVSA